MIGWAKSVMVSAAGCLKTQSAYDTPFLFRHTHSKTIDYDYSGIFISSNPRLNGSPKTVKLFIMHPAFGTKSLAVSLLWFQDNQPLWSVFSSALQPPFHRQLSFLSYLTSANYVSKKETKQPHACAEKKAPILSTLHSRLYMLRGTNRKVFLFTAFSMLVYRGLKLLYQWKVLLCWLRESAAIMI